VTGHPARKPVDIERITLPDGPAPGASDDIIHGFGEAPNGWLALAEVQPHGQVTSDARGYHFCAGCVASFDRWMNHL